MFVVNGAGTVVDHCFLQGGDGGIDITGDSVVVESVKVRSIDDDGIRITGNDAVVRKCDLFLTHCSSIEVDGSSALIEKNVCSSPESVAIDVAGADAVIRKNTIAGAAGDGIRLSGVGAKVQGNVIRACDGRGIDANSADNGEFSKNDISVCNGAGICVVGTACVISKNHLAGLFGDGIDVTGANAVIEKNDVRETDAGIGVNVDGNNPTVVGNKLTNLWDDADGIELCNCTGGVVADNTILGASDYGIDLESSSANVLVENNTIRETGNCSEFGMNLLGSGHTVRNNVVRVSFGDGIHVEADGVTLQGNKSLDNGEDGIDVHIATGVTVDDNVAKGNAAEGIENNGTGTVITNNVAKKNRIDFANDGTVAAFSGNQSGDGSDDSTAPEIDN